MGKTRAYVGEIAVRNVHEEKGWSKVIGDSEKKKQILIHTYIYVYSHAQKPDHGTCSHVYINKENYRKKKKRRKDKKQIK